MLFGSTDPHSVHWIKKEGGYDKMSNNGNRVG